MNNMIIVYDITCWETLNLPQIFTVISRICIGKVAWFAVYICGNFWVTQYVYVGTKAIWIDLLLNISMQF